MSTPTATHTHPHVTCPQPAMTTAAPVVKTTQSEPPAPSSLYGQPMSAVTEPRGEIVTPTEPQAEQERLALDGQLVEVGYEYGV